MASITLSSSARLSLILQRVLGWLFFVLVGPGAIFTMAVVRRNRIEGAAEARRIYEQALATGRPTMICCNHLTMVDSAYLQWAMCPLWKYFLSYRRFPWNVAAVEHLKSRPPLLLICYLGKVMPIDRDGTEEHRKGVLDKLRWLMGHGEVVFLFPEGTRSRTGRIDVENATYGVGQILKDVENPQVLCAYVRGANQQQMSSVPPAGDTVKVELEIFEPKTAQTGLRAVRDLSRQVIDKLKQMEDKRLGPTP